MFGKKIFVSVFLIRQGINSSRTTIYNCSRNANKRFISSLIYKADLPPINNETISYG
jgi:hypothetical protein